MASNHELERVAADLTGMLSGSFPGLTVQVGENSRWKRACATFVWSGFEGLLPEERFHRLTRVIPEDFITTRMTGMIWLELTPGESVESFLAQPRSEDVVEKEPHLYSRLLKRGFFKKLSGILGGKPKQGCKGGFDESVRVLSGHKASREVIRDTKLMFIRHHAYCDCEVLLKVRSELDKLHAGVA